MAADIEENFVEFNVPKDAAQGYVKVAPLDWKTALDYFWNAGAWSPLLLLKSVTRKGAFTCSP